MFLLGIGEILEEWTHKKSVGDLARSMSLNIEKVWQKIDDTEVLVPVSDIREGDLVVVHTGNVIPLDGIVEAGEAMVAAATKTVSFSADYYGKAENPTGYQISSFSSASLFDRTAMSRSFFIFTMAI